MNRLNNQIGYLILKEDGALLESGGELENDEKRANIFQGLLNITESIDENFMPKNGCERVSIVYEDHSYNICMSNRRIFIVKLRNTMSNVGIISNSNEGNVFSSSEKSPRAVCCAFCAHSIRQRSPAYSACDEKNRSRRFNWKTPFIYLIILFICQKIHHL
uniref:Late endosomal/lysosomal adaptor and MAPK and MTOR activator 4 n=1 Tax=Glossina brevipalpis TaxID=37001 RepID=A0A1A9W742_9MUSC